MANSCCISSPRFWQLLQQAVELLPHQHRQHLVHTAPRRSAMTPPRVHAVCTGTAHGSVLGFPLMGFERWFSFAATDFCQNPCKTHAATREGSTASCCPHSHPASCFLCTSVAQRQLGAMTNACEVLRPSVAHERMINLTQVPAYPCLIALVDRRTASFGARGRHVCRTVLCSRCDYRPPILKCSSWSPSRQGT